MADRSNEGGHYFAAIYHRKQSRRCVEGLYSNPEKGFCYVQDPQQNYKVDNALIFLRRAFASHRRELNEWLSTMNHEWLFEI